MTVKYDNTELMVKEINITLPGWKLDSLWESAMVEWELVIWKNVFFMPKKLLMK
jgi:hypothetical protein